MSDHNQPDPLSEAVFLILVTLAGEDLHGYAIMQEVEAISNGRVRFSTGTLYGAIRRLLERQWIERLEGDETDNSGRERKIYRLTKSGRDVLTIETHRMQRLASFAQNRLEKGSAGC